MSIRLIKRIGLFIWVLLYYNVVINAQSTDTSEIISLDDDWEFSRAGADKWLPATVPGTVHQDLIRHNLLPDPFYGTNEEKIQWVENEDWEYKTSFSVSADKSSSQYAFCHGIWSISRATSTIDSSLKMLSTDVYPLFVRMIA